MHRTPCTQADRSLLHLCATSVLAVGMVVCAVSTAYSFSAGPLPGLNCDGRLCDLTTILSQYEEVHQNITFEALIGVRFTPPSSGSLVRFAPRPMQEIEDANARTDYNQGDHSLHFDDSFLNEGGNRLIKGKQLLLGMLRIKPTASPREVSDMRTLLGWYLHTLQDFYSHSNYVSLQNPPIMRLGDVPIPSQPSFSFPCVPLLSGTLSDNGKKDLLTTGWALNPLGAAIAPLGQCAHGFILNGIHKDWSDRTGHDVARFYARAATTAFVNSIIQDPLNNPDNVCQLMTGEPCQQKPSCPDPGPNISASAQTINSGTVTKTQPGPISVSLSDGAASASAGGIKGSVTVNSSGSDQVGGGSIAHIEYQEYFQITSPGKSGTGQATVTLQVGASASAGQINSSISVGTGPGQFAFYQDIDGTIYSQTSMTVFFTYGTTGSFDAFIAASAGNQSTAGAFASGSLGYSITVSGDPNATVTWCRVTQ